MTENGKQARTQTQDGNPLAGTFVLGVRGKGVS